MNKVLMIGLDGATFALLNPLMDEGVMPFLKSFISGGVHADLMSTENPLTPPAWMSMITGRSPTVHSIFDFLRPHDTGDVVFLKVNDSRDIRCETIWFMAGRQGKRVASFNFYGMAPAFPVNGYLISEFVPWKHLRGAIYPAAFYDTLKTIPGLSYKHLGMAINEEKDVCRAWRMPGMRTGSGSRGTVIKPGRGFYATCLSMTRRTSRQ
jgi:predicted AlkP superfamily phosphohydrolase/phosphomutase